VRQQLSGGRRRDRARCAPTDRSPIFARADPLPDALALCDELPRRHGKRGRYAVDASEFLRTLWGDQPAGLIELWTKADKKSHYLRSPLGAGVVAAPGRPDVYTGVTLAYKDPGRSRRARNEQRVALAGLWLDLDVCGGPDRKTGAAPDKARRDRAGRAAARADAGHRLRLRHPRLVAVRAPWTFTSRADQEAAALAAAQWYALHRAAAQAHGWTIDHTHDLARLLRIPGTVNAKDPERPRVVEMIRDHGPRYPREELLDHAAQAGDVTTAVAASSGPVAFVLRSNAAARAGGPRRAGAQRARLPRHADPPARRDRGRGR
jgi:hypothetical protein